MLLGISRYEASRFSFLLAIPITLGVGIKNPDLLALDEAVAVAPLFIGAVVATTTAFIVIHYFLKFIQYTLWPFVWYSLILAGFIGYVAFIT